MIPESIEHALTNIEVELEQLEPSRKEQGLDMLDSFRAALRTLLDPKGNEPTGDEDKDYEENHREVSDHDSRLTPVADK